MTGDGVLALSGPLVVAGSVALVVVATAATLVLWPRLSGRRSPRHLLARVGLLLTGHVCVLLAAAVLLNDQFQFYSSWTDLAGALRGSPVHVVSTSGGAGPALVPSSPGPPVHRGGPGPASTGVPTGADGHLLRYRVTGAASGITADVYVQLPADLATLARSGRHLPVLETFAGYPADPRQWLGALGLQGTLDRLAGTGALTQPIVVLPTVEVPPGTDTECADSGHPGGQVETWLARDVPDWVAATFPVAATRQGWATMGLSTGGYCAAMLAMHHPGAYAAGIAFGGYFRAEFSTGGVGSGPVRPREDARLAAYDLVAQAEHDPPAVALWLLTSRADRVSYASTQALVRAARPPLSVHVDTLVDAGHRTAVYAPLVGTALTWLAQHAPDFAGSRHP